MNDTAPWAEEKLREIYGAMTATERVQIAAGMFETAKQLMAANIRAEHPEFSDIEVRLRIFERTYRQDFTPAEMVDILDRLRAAWSATAAGLLD